MRMMPFQKCSVNFPKKGGGGGGLYVRMHILFFSQPPSGMCGKCLSESMWEYSREMSRKFTMSDWACQYF